MTYKVTLETIRQMAADFPGTDAGERWSHTLALAERLEAVEQAIRDGIGADDHAASSLAKRLAATLEARLDNVDKIQPSLQETYRHLRDKIAALEKENKGLQARWEAHLDESLEYARSERQIAALEAQLADERSQLQRQVSDLRGIIAALEARLETARNTVEVQARGLRDKTARLATVRGWVAERMQESQIDGKFYIPAETFSKQGEWYHAIFGDEQQGRDCPVCADQGKPDCGGSRKPPPAPCPHCARLRAAAAMGLLLIDNIGLIDNGRNGCTGPSGYPDEGEVRTGEAVEELRAALAATPQPGEGWISVEDRMPEENGHFLVYETPTSERGDDERNIRWFHKPSGKWFDGDGDGIECVTHWMPLPAPPAAKEQT